MCGHRGSELHQVFLRELAGGCFQLLLLRGKNKGNRHTASFATSP